MKHRLRRTWLVPLAFAMLFPTTSIAAELSGIVYGHGRIPLAGVSVDVTLGEIDLHSTTNADGRFHFCCVPEGRAHVVLRDERASVPGRIPVTLSHLRPSRVVAEWMAGNPGMWSFWEDLVGQDFSSAMSRLYTREQLDLLPSTLDLWNLLGHTEISASAERFDTAGMQGGKALLAAAHGGSWSQTGISWNGFSIGDGGGRALVVPDLSAVESIVYDAGPEGLFPAGAKIALLPARGESIPRGSAQVLFQGNVLQSVNVTPYLRSFGITESDERYRYFFQGNVQAGGPIASRWTYFASVSRRQAETRVRNHALPARRSLTTESADFTGQLSRRSRLGVTWLAQQNSQPQEGILPQVARESTRDRSDSFQSLQGVWTRAVSDRTLIDARAAWSAAGSDAAIQAGVETPHREALFAGFVDIPLVPSAEAGKSIVALLNHVRTGAAPVGVSLRDRTLQVQTQLHASRSGPERLNHQIALGLDFARRYQREKEHAFRDIHLQFFQGEPAFAQLLDAGDATHRTSQVRAYAADNMRVGGVSFALSGEADWTRGADRVDWVSVAGHAGVSYVLGSRYPTMLSGAVSHRLHDAVMRVLKATHPDGAGLSRHLWSDTNGDLDFQPGELGTKVKVMGAPFTRVVPGLKQPYAREVRLRVSQQLPGSLTLSLHGFRAVQHRLLALINIGVPSSAYDAVLVFDPGNDGATQTGDEFSLYAYNQHPQTLGQDAYELVNSGDVGAFSEGYEARVRQTMRRVQWEIAFTRYRAVARAAPGNGPLQNDWAVLGVMNDPNESINAYGSTFFDRGLGARFLGIVEPAWGLRFSWICAYLDGAPYGRMLPVRGMNQGIFGVLATRRGPGDGSPGDGKRTAYNLTTDFRFSRSFAFGDRRVDATVDIFNALNVAHALQEADVTSPLHLWRIPLQYQTPRSVQLGVRFNW